MRVLIEIDGELWEILDFLGEPIQQGYDYVYTVIAERYAGQ